MFSKLKIGLSIVQGGVGLRQHAEYCAIAAPRPRFQHDFPAAHRPGHGASRYVPTSPTTPAKRPRLVGIFQH